MKLYNSMSNQVETFSPRDNTLTVYVCGITPYDTTHVGHAFTYTSIDILIRYMELHGVRVKYAQNVTDIDDDILRKAKQVGEDWTAVGNQWTQRFIQDMKQLNVRPPDFYPRATEVIPEIIADVERLVAAGVAYESNGNVYFHVNDWDQFGKLSKLSRSEMLPVANERGNRPDDPNKRDPLDFVLWQAQAPGEPAWSSPWGMGRPGWHIECSTMARKYLGDTIDIHSGGADLCFPHHECEIAQVEPVDKDEIFARVWMHVAMVRYQGEKMSKSLGNLVMVKNLLEEYSPDAIRLYLGSHHYRDSWSYEESGMNRSSRLASQIREAATATGGTGANLEAEAYWAAFTEYMEDDLNTPKAVELLANLAEDISEAALARRDVNEAQHALLKFGSVFGLRFDQAQPEGRVLEGWDKHLQKFLTTAG